MHIFYNVHKMSMWLHLWKFMKHSFLCSSIEMRNTLCVTYSALQTGISHLFILTFQYGQWSAKTCVKSFIGTGNPGCGTFSQTYYSCQTFFIFFYLTLYLVASFSFYKVSLFSHFANNLCKFSFEDNVNIINIFKFY